jgi:hypothetical protein
MGLHSQPACGARRFLPLREPGAMSEPADGYWGLPRACQSSGSLAKFAAMRRDLYRSCRFGGSIACGVFGCAPLISKTQASSHNQRRASLYRRHGRI